VLEPSQRHHAVLRDRQAANLSKHKSTMVSFICVACGTPWLAGQQGLSCIAPAVLLHHLKCCVPEQQDHVMRTVLAWTAAMILVNLRFKVFVCSLASVLWADPELAMTMRSMRFALVLLATTDPTNTLQVYNNMYIILGSEAFGGLGQLRSMYCCHFCCAEFASRSIHSITPWPT
jgi:hypothetical protein